MHLDKLQGVQYYVHCKNTPNLLHVTIYIGQTWFSEKYFSRYRQKHCFRRKKLNEAQVTGNFPRKKRNSSQKLKYTKKQKKQKKWQSTKHCSCEIFSDKNASNFFKFWSKLFLMNLRHLAISSKIRNPPKNTEKKKKKEKEKKQYTVCIIPIFRLVLVKFWVFDPPACSYIELSNIVLNKYQHAFSWMYFCGYANGSNANGSKCHVIKYQYLVPFCKNLSIWSPGCPNIV